MDGLFFSAKGLQKACSNATSPGRPTCEVTKSAEWERFTCGAWPASVDAGAAPAGGVLLYSEGRSATESLFHAIATVSGCKIKTVNDEYGGESFKRTAGVPVAGLNLSMAAGARYVHVKEGHIARGLKQPNRVRSPTQLMQLARAAGFTTVVIHLRSNEFARYLSGLEYGCSGECAPKYKNLCAEGLTQRLGLAGRRAEGGVRAARDAGLAVVLTTFEDVVEDACSVASSVLRVYNKVSAAAARHSVVSSRSGRTRLALKDRIGERAHECVVKALSPLPAFRWMLDGNGTRLRPPPEFDVMARLDAETPPTAPSTIVQPSENATAKAAAEAAAKAAAKTAVKAAAKAATKQNGDRSREAKAAAKARIRSQARREARRAHT